MDQRASSEAGVDRRTVLTGTIAAIGGVVSGLLGVPAAAVLRSPSAGAADSWIRVGPVTAVEPGTIVPLSVSVEEKQGWVSERRNLTLFLKTDDGRNFEALSNVCTHLGCWVTLSEAVERPGFYCACHDGWFDLDGNVVAGPPPAPLARLEVRTEAGQIYVREP